MATAKWCITGPKGFRAAGGTCGIKPSGQPDLALIVADEPCSAAGVFTTSKVPGAPVVICRKHLRSSSGVARAIVCNSGISNVCTGKAGERDARTICEEVAQHAGCERDAVLPCSTGVIGVPLPMDKLRRGIAALMPRLSRGRRADAEAARAIMTTDLVPKTASRSVTLGRSGASSGAVRIAGIAKGSGMIAPDMATMLAFITTDAAIEPAVLRQALRAAADASFNRISVDHDTSTSDTVLVLASGRAGAAPITAARGSAYDAFAAALAEVCRDLAYQIVKDGEGATKVFRVLVRGARTRRDADRVGRTVVGSPLVKTAIHGADPNWGRLVMAVGRSGAAVRPQNLAITIGDQQVCQHGQPTTLTKPALRRLVRIMRRKEIDITIDLGLGSEQADWLGCDLSKQYVAINAEYTT